MAWAWMLCESNAIIRAYSESIALIIIVVECKNVSRDRIALKAGWLPGEPPGVSVVDVVNGVNSANGVNVVNGVSKKNTASTASTASAKAAASAASTTSTACQTHGFNGFNGCNQNYLLPLDISELESEMVRSKPIRDAWSTKH